MAHLSHLETERKLRTMRYWHSRYHWTVLLIDQRNLCSVHMHIVISQLHMSTCYIFQANSSLYLCLSGCTKQPSFHENVQETRALESGAGMLYSKLILIPLNLYFLLVAYQKTSCINTQKLGCVVDSTWYLRKLREFFIVNNGAFEWHLSFFKWDWGHMQINFSILLVGLEVSL
jgi:hypothetical protein